MRADVLRAFARAAGRRGFDELAYAPAYGLAEASLAVTMVRPEERWSARRVETEALSDDRFVEAPAGGGAELVSLGRPIPDVRVRHAAPGDDRLGTLLVRSPALLSEYVGDMPTPVRDGWLETRDVGCVVDGELYVAGRTDDRLFVAGRNLYAFELERVAGSHDAVRPGSCVAVPDGGGRFAVLAERRSRGPAGAELARACRWIRVELARRYATTPSSVAFVAPGSLHKTPSGKLQRRRIEHAFQAGRLPIEHREDFSTRIQSGSGGTR